MSQKFFTLFIILFCSLKSFAFTGDSLHIVTKNDTLFIEVGIYKSPVYTHQLAKGQTLYSLAAFYGLKVFELYYYNPGLKNKVIQPGEKIIIPIPPQSLIKDKKPKFAVPVIYKVKPKDTFYGISKTYFNIGMDTLLSLNNKKDKNLALGEALILGYLPLGGLERIEKVMKGSPLLQMSFEFKKGYYKTMADKEEVRDQGRGTRIVNDNTDGLYVLHKTAAINSIIGIYNPLKKRIIYAKVLGRIPRKNEYYNSILVVNKNVGDLLGIKDDGFFVKVKYLK